MDGTSWLSERTLPLLRSGLPVGEGRDLRGTGGDGGAGFSSSSSYSLGGDGAFGRSAGCLRTDADGTGVISSSS